MVLLLPRVQGQVAVVPAVVAVDEVAAEAVHLKPREPDRERGAVRLRRQVEPEVRYRLPHAAFPRERAAVNRVSGIAVCRFRLTR